MTEAIASRAELARFQGRSRADAKRKALNYWCVNREKLGLDLREFSARCRLMDDERTIVLYSG